MEKITMAAEINRNFYQNLLKQGNSHIEIMFMIQPDRYIQFYKDIFPLLERKSSFPKSLSRWEKIKRFFKFKKK